MESPNLTIQIKLLVADAKVPQQGSKYAVGYDLYYPYSQEIIIKPLDKQTIKTGIALEIPNEYYVRIAPRSGLAFKNSISVGAGIIDPDFRGEVQVLLFNHSDKESVTIKKGDKIAQMIIEKRYTVQFKKADALTLTERNEKGFGSTN